MKLTTVIGSVNDNREYYDFIPKQILFWGKFGIKFIAIFVGNKIPHNLLKYQNNIILWNHNLDINTAFVGQNLRMYYAALLNLPDDEIVMITDMDMLPANSHYFKDGLEKFTKDDFIYYRHIHKNQPPRSNEIYMCYNAAHPHIWAKLFKINCEEDVINIINTTYNPTYDNVNINEGWFTDQFIMYDVLHNYEHLKVLNKCPRRLECNVCEYLMQSNIKNYINNFDDMHFHRSYSNNINLIADVERQLLELYP